MKLFLANLYKHAYIIQKIRYVFTGIGSFKQGIFSKGRKERNVI